MIIDCGVCCDGHRLPGAGLDGLGEVAARPGAPVRDYLGILTERAARNELDRRRPAAA
ncbi:MAG: hypothetical protein OEY41_05470 [Acidimicrobiia bacterium]|nr:hypothetical protein [Acidimicrobiia bacterium]